MAILVIVALVTRALLLPMTRRGLFLLAFDAVAWTLRPHRPRGLDVIHLGHGAPPEKFSLTSEFPYTELINFAKSTMISNSPSRLQTPDTNLLPSSVPTLGAISI